MKKFLAALALSISPLLSAEINVAVAANVSYAIDTLKKEFNKTHPGITVQVTLGSSGKLTAQIKHGAPYQLFMSANMKYTEALFKDSIAITEPMVYAQGSLAYLSAKQRNFSNPINILRSDKISRIAVANPKTAPYGKAAFEAMKNANILDTIKKKFVYGESISQTVSYAVIAADIGIIAKSSLYSPRMARFKEGINWISVDSKLYTPINQGIVILKRGKGNSEVKAFYDFILSESAQKIFSDFGYLTP